jgi:hypothetical protein
MMSELHLFELATVSRARRQPFRTASPDVPLAVRHVLGRLEPTPAFVVGATGEVLAYNGTWDAVAGPLGMLDDQAPNLIRYTFADPRAKDVYPDWAGVADAQVAALRQGTVRAGPSAPHDALISELLPLPEFASRWAAHDVGDRCADVTRIMHPDRRAATDVPGAPRPRGLLHPRGHVAARRRPDRRRPPPRRGPVHRTAPGRRRRLKKLPVRRPRTLAVAVPGWPRPSSSMR